MRETRNDKKKSRRRTTKKDRSSFLRTQKQNYIKTKEPLNRI